ncbi:hypothetical protein NLO98_16870 [Pseudomonas syringae]|nr:hypothetical protein [Pseudomonas syringae]
MSTRNQLTKLRTALGKARGDETVQAISRLIDELSAAAAGGSLNPDRMTLTEYFEPQLQPQSNHRYTK